MQINYGAIGAATAQSAGGAALANLFVRR